MSVIQETTVISMNKVCVLQSYYNGTRLSWGNKCQILMENAYRLSQPSACHSYIRMKFTKNFLHIIGSTEWSQNGPCLIYSFMLRLFLWCYQDLT